MVRVGLLLRLEAKPGKEAEVAAFLTSALRHIEAEDGTTAWFGIQIGPSTFGIFDAFPDEDGRKAHMTGEVPGLLGAQWPALLTSPPSVEKVDILAAKIPAATR